MVPPLTGGCSADGRGFARTLCMPATGGCCSMVAGRCCSTRLHSKHRLQSHSKHKCSTHEESIIMRRYVPSAT